RELLDSRGVDERFDLGADRRFVALLRNAKMRVGECGDLRQMRTAQLLPAFAERLKEAADGRSDGAPNAGVHFVEDERRHLAHFARDNLDRKRDARQLAARRHFGERPERLLRMARDAELYLFTAVACRRLETGEGAFVLAP